MLANKSTVFVGNIPFDTNQEKVKEIMQQVAPVKNLKMITDKNSGMPRGFAFCEYFEEKHAIAAINSLDQQEINGRRIKVDFSEHHDPESEGLKSRISPETKKEIENALKKLTLSEIYDVVSEMKLLIERDRKHAEKLLTAKPELAQALLTGQLMLGMAQISASMQGQRSSAPASSNMPPHPPSPASSRMSDEHALIQHVRSMNDQDFQNFLNQADPSQVHTLQEIRRQIMG